MTAAAAALFIWITADILADGKLDYAIDNGFEDMPVSTRTLPEALAVWATFGSLFSGLVILGIRPRLFMENKWIWGGLLAILIAGYVTAGLLRWFMLK